MLYSSKGLTSIFSTINDALMELPVKFVFPFVSIRMELGDPALNKHFIKTYELVNIKIYTNPMMWAFWDTFNGKDMVSLQLFFPSPKDETTIWMSNAVSNVLISRKFTSNSNES